MHMVPVFIRSTGILINSMESALGRWPGLTVPVLGTCMYVCGRVDNRYDARIRVVYQYTSVLRFLSFVPLTPELTIYLCSTASTYYSCLRTYYMHMVPVFIRSTGILINSMESALGRWPGLSIVFL
jgi:hypothetical protein